MLTERSGCSHLNSTERARKDFKLYMSKLLERSANLDAFRSTSQLQQREAEASASHGSPAWGPAVERTEDASTPGSDIRGRSSVGRADATLPSSYFRDKQHWPRAGTATPPRLRAPPNFSWDLRAPLSPPSGPAAPHQPSQRCRIGGDSENGQSLFPDEQGMSRSLDAQPSAQQAPAAKFDSLESDESDNGEEEDGAGGWKAVWSRRLARGPVYTEYRDSFPWPADTAQETIASTTGVGTVPFESPARNRRPQETFSGIMSGRDTLGGGLVGGGVSSGVGDALEKMGGRRYHGVNEAASAAAPAGTVSPRRQPGPAAGAPDSQFNPIPDEPPPPRAPARAGMEGVSVRSGDGLFEPPLPQSEQVGWKARKNAVDQERINDDDFERKRNRTQRQNQQQHEKKQHDSRAQQNETEGEVPGAEADVFERQSRAAVGSRVADAGSLVQQVRGGDRGASLLYEQDGQGDYSALGGEEAPSGEVVQDLEGGSATRAAGGQFLARQKEVTIRGAGVEEKEGGRDVEKRGGHVAIDLASQSIVTENMEEFVWPTKLPKPGRRGKRNGMGMDHVGRLLAGRPAEERPRKPDAELIARLGAAVDRALSAAKPGHLTEMCTMRSPSPTARRLVLGLIVAFGLRWRRWSDVRKHLLGSTAELKGHISRFDKDRVGLSSDALRPYVEDPNLSPVQVDQVAVCMVWVSRWLRALYDYLSVKEGKVLVPPARFPVSTIGSKQRRHSHRHAHKASSLVPPALPRGAVGGVGSRKGVRRTRGRGDGTDGVRGGGADGGLTGHVVEAEAQRTRFADAAASTDLERRPPAHVTSARTEQPAMDDERVSTSSQALATRGQGSRIPRFSAVPTESVKGHSGGRVEERGEGDRRVFGGGRGGNEDGGVPSRTNFEGSDAGMASESAWTVGTVTSRGDVLGAPTEEQVDAGCLGLEREGEVFSKSSVGRNARRARHVTPDGGVQTRAEVTGAGSRMREPLSKVNQGSSVINHSHGTQHLSDGCVYSHVHKGPTPSHFANPKARRPGISRHNPILANQRWPPPVGVKPRERTEQRSAFSLEHSFVALER